VILVDELQWDINQKEKEIWEVSQMMEGFCFATSVTGLSMPNIEINYDKFGFMENMIQLYNFLLMNELQISSDNYYAFLFQTVYIWFAAWDQGW
jgi:pyruvate formate-lyase activating enzyme-like uncharacterized protein